MVAGFNHSSRAIGGVKLSVPLSVRRPDHVTDVLATTVRVDLHRPELGFVSIHHDYV